MMDRKRKNWRGIQRKKREMGKERKEWKGSTL